MDTENFTTVEKLFAELVKNNPKSKDVDFNLIAQLQGQFEDSLGLLNDVVDELREIAPEAIVPLKSLTLKIFEFEGESM